MAANPSPLVSAIIPVFNGERYIGEAIDSVLDQTYAPVECLVVDDGSTDGTSTAVARYGERVRYLRKPNGGVSSARNFGVSLARGGFVAFLDADDVWVPEKLSHQMAVFDEDPELGMVYSGIHVVAEDLSVVGEMRAPHPDAALRNSLLMEMPVMTITMTAVLPTWVVRDVGGFDEGLSTSADRDFACRVALSHCVTRVGELFALYRRQREQMHRDLTTMERDMAEVYRKLFGQGKLPPSVENLRRWGYANLHTAIATAALARKEVPAGVAHLGRAFLWSPTRTASLILGQVVRKLGRPIRTPAPRSGPLRRVDDE